MDHDVARILDANFNRAREGLRVAEEYARFVVEDRRLAGQAKQFRHELAELARRMDPDGQLLRARDTAGDVGTAIRNESESNRPDAASVATAAAKRVGEALRVLAEYAKVVPAAGLPCPAEAVERIRYRFYDWEKWLDSAGDRRRFARVRLYLLVSQRYCRGGDWRRAVAEAIEGGVDAIQLREKDLPDGELLRRADWLAETCRSAGVLSVINDRLDVARLANADGVHVGQDDLPVAAVRKLLRPTQFVGLSTHTPEQLDAALAGPALPDYIAAGPVFATATKPQEHVAGPAYAAKAVARLDELGIPHVAIGGIGPENIGQVIAAGVRCVAVCSAVLGADNPSAAARALREAMELRIAECELRNKDGV